MPKNETLINRLVREFHDFMKLWRGNRFIAILVVFALILLCAYLLRGNIFALFKTKQKQTNEITQKQNENGVRTIPDLDQSNTPIGGPGGLEITKSQSVGQSFTIGRNGVLYKIELLDIKPHRCIPQKSLYFSLINMAGEELGVITYYTREFHSYEVKGSLIINLGIKVLVGEKFAIYLETDAESSGCTYAWGGAINTYEGGSTYINGKKNPRDMKFKIYIK